MAEQKPNNNSNEGPYNPHNPQGFPPDYGQYPPSAYGQPANGQASYGQHPYGQPQPVYYPYNQANQPTDVYGQPQPPYVPAAQPYPQQPYQQPYQQPTVPQTYPQQVPPSQQQPTQQAPVPQAYSQQVPPSQQQPTQSWNNWQDQISAEPSVQTDTVEQRPRRDWMELFSRVFVGLFVTFLCVYMGWLYAPRVRNSMTFWPTQTATPITPTPTAVFTSTVTPLPTNTSTPQPTATPGPISAFWVADGSTIDPPLANAPSGVVQLDVNKNAEVNPSLDSVQWTSAKKIASDLGVQFYEANWYATLADGWVRWFMDDALPEGLYEIYSMDTLYSSGGTLDFIVKLGEQTLVPLTGSQSVYYMTSQYEPVQGGDVWRSLGIYFLGPSKNILTVSCSWQPRDEYTYVAVDRLLVVPRRAADLSLLNKLNFTGTRYVMDDTQAEITAGGSLIERNDNLAWDDAYQLIMSPKQKATMIYNSREPWPIGTYHILVWMPASKGGINATAQVFIDNTVFSNNEELDAVSITAPASDEGQWVSLGTYTTDRYYERPVKFKVQFTIDANEAGEFPTGEFPVDAVAFIHNPF